MSLAVPALIIIVLILFIVIAISRQRSYWKKKRVEARNVAIERSVSVQEVERMVPLYSGRFRSRHAKVRLKSEIVPEYSIPNNRVTSTRWKFCQREFQSDKNFPDEWTLETEFGEPTEDDKKLLREIADDEMWIEGYFEIMFSPSRVCVYWDEYAGSEGAEKVIGYLRKLAND